jgi:hypothetical protein
MNRQFYQERLQYQKEIQKLKEKVIEKETKLWDEGRYTDQTRETIMNLSSIGISSQQIPLATSIYAKLFHTNIDRIPSVSTVQNISREAGIIAEIHLASTMTEAKAGHTLGKDTTSFKRLDITSNRIYLVNTNGEEKSLTEHAATSRPYFQGAIRGISSMY